MAANNNPLIYAENFVVEREKHEFNKYGRMPNREAIQYPTRDLKHSIEPKYGNYDRPINEIV